MTSLFALKETLQRYENVLGPVLKRAAGGTVRGVTLGIVVTACIQSSSATNAMTVGLVGAGLLDLRHAFAIVLGSNIGTTLTGQFVAFNIYALALPAFLAGLVMQCFNKDGFRQGGRLMMSIGALFYGLWLMGEALQRLDQSSFLMSMLQRAEGSDWLSLLTGMLLTITLQSSSAVTSILVSLAEIRIISVKTGIGAALGSNVGTVLTTILASLSAGLVARRVALMDLLFNLFGALLFLPFISTIMSLMPMISLHPGRQIAHAHSFFNIVTVIIAIPLINQLASLVERITAKNGKE